MGEWLLPAVLVLVLDQASKGLALSRWSERPDAPARRGPRLRAVLNTRFARGFLGDRRVLLGLWAIATVGTILLLHGFDPAPRRPVRAGLGAALGGATGNLLDVLRRGVVVDFVDLRVWPVFNLADVAIVAGVVVALLSIW